MLPPATVVSTETGQYLLFESPDGISGTLRTHGKWEPVTLMIAKALVTIGGGRGTIVDGGANVGAFTIPMALTFRESCRVVAFEAQRIVAYQLCGSVVLNRLETVVVHNLALGASAGRIAVPRPDYAGDPNIGSVSLDAEVRRIRRDAGTGCQTDGDGTAFEEVDLVPLDRFGLNDLCLLKLDVEGMELAAIQGAEATLRANAYPPILFELWDPVVMPAIAEPRQRLTAHLQALGYEVTTLGETALAQHKTRKSVLQFSSEDGGRRITARQVNR